MDKVKHKILFIMIFIIFSSSNKNLIYAMELNIDTIKVYYYEEVNDGIELTFKEINYINEDLETKIFLNLEYLFNEDKSLCIPEGTKVLNLFIAEKDLYINFNNNILNHGGNYYEYILLKQIFMNSLQYDEIDSVTILVDWKFLDFPEGQNIYRVFQYE